MLNQYINVRSESEQDLAEDLVVESLEIYGEQFYYIPRKLVSVDDLIGEDRLSEFKNAYPIVAYFENVTNFDGQGAFIQRFGGLLEYSATLTIARRHWEQFVGQYGETVLPNRPASGDLIYYPLTDGLFEVKWVEDKSPFAQLGRFYTYRLTIELFHYSSERIETECGEIDAFQSLKTLDIDPNESVWGGIESVSIINPGKGYTEPPTIKVESLTGYGAEFKVNLGENGQIESVDILDSGQGYASGDIIHVYGECSEPAELSIIITTQIENVAERWASNKIVNENVKDYLVDFKNPFET